MTAFSLWTLIVGYVLALAGLILLVSRLRRLPWRGAFRSLRIWWSSPWLDDGLRTAAVMLPGAGLASAAVAEGWVSGDGWSVLAKLALVVAPGIGAVYLVLRLFAAARRETPRAGDKGRVARGPVASPAAGGWGGDATVYFPQSPVASLPPQVRGGVRAGRAAASVAAGRPASPRLESAPVTAPRRAGWPRLAGGAGAATPQTPVPAWPRAHDVARRAGLERGRVYVGSRS